MEKNNKVNCIVNDVVENKEEIAVKFEDGKIYKNGVVVGSYFVNKNGVPSFKVRKEGQILVYRPEVNDQGNLIANKGWHKMVSMLGLNPEAILHDEQERLFKIQVANDRRHGVFTEEVEVNGKVRTLKGVDWATTELYDGEELTATITWGKSWSPSVVLHKVCSTPVFLMKNGRFGYAKVTEKDGKKIRTLIQFKDKKWIHFMEVFFSTVIAKLAEIKQKEYPDISKVKRVAPKYDDTPEYWASMEASAPAKKYRVADPNKKEVK